MGYYTGQGASDHGELTGLADDDHSQYHNDARGDARYALLSSLDAANGIATLDSNGKVLTTQLPGLSLTSTFLVADQTAMLALDAQTGDVAVRTDENKSYILEGSDPASLGDWQVLLTPTDQVQSVFGRSGTVSSANGDYTASQITFVAAGNIEAVTVQDAIEELDTEKASVAYVDSIVGLDFQDSVIDRDLSDPPGGSSSGDRYLVNAVSTPLSGNCAEVSASVGGGDPGDYFECTDYGQDVRGFSFFGWFRFNSISNNWAFTDFYTGSEGWLIRLEANSNKVRLSILNGGWDYTLDSATLSTATWYHIGFTVGTDGTTTLYVNGNATEASAAAPDVAITSAIMGRKAGRTLFQGQIDLLAEWNSELSSSEVSDLYGGDFPTQITTAPARVWDAVDGASPHSPSTGTGNLTEPGQAVGDFIGRAPANGAPAATGAWADHVEEIAEDDGAGGWNFTAPSEGTTVWVEDENIYITYNGTAWVATGSTFIHNNLGGLTTGDPHTQYILADGSRAFTGNIDLGNNAITNATIAAGLITSGTFADGRIAESNVTQHQAAINHDALSNFVANEHVDHSSVSLTINGTSNQVNVSAGNGDLTTSRTWTLSLPQDVHTGASPTFVGGQFTGNLTIDGNLTVSGTTATVDTETLAVEDPLIKVGKNNTASHAVDLGLYGAYDPSGTDLYCGLFFDATDDKFKLFDSLEDEPTTTVDIGGTGYAVGTLVADLEGNVTGQVSDISNHNIDPIANKKSNLSASTDPTATDDSSEGYGVGSFWVNTTGDKIFQCADATEDAAVWKELSATGSGGTVQDGSSKAITPADEGSPAGNARGNNAVDLQSSRVGASRVASGTNAVLAGGDDNTASGDNSVASGGVQNNVAGENSMVPGGYQAITDKYGQHSHSAGALSTVGDAQFSRLVGRKTTINNTASQLFLNGSTLHFEIAAQRMWAFQGLIGCRQSAGSAGSTNDAKAWQISGVIKRDASNNTALVGTPTITVLGADSNLGANNASGAVIALTADDTNEALKIGVTGETDKTLKWFGWVELAEVG